jgi:membrane protease subunit HflC
VTSSAIQSEACRLAQELRRKRDAEATAICADVSGRDAEFYFFKSLETYERTIDGKTYFVLGTESDLLRYVRSPASGRSRGLGTTSPTSL